MKKTAISPSNIAFIKYWGKKDDLLRLPENGSFSMNLSNLTTTTTVEFSSELKSDMVVIDGVELDREVSRVVDHLNLIREKTSLAMRAKVVSKNSFPSGRGLSSSASGFAALTVAATAAAGLSISEKDLTILARQGSGSACRSIPDGFVEWKDGSSHEDSYAYTVFPPEHWNIIDIVAVVGVGKKEIPTSEGMKGTQNSPFFTERIKRLPAKLEHLKTLVMEKNFEKVGEIIELEALEMHAIMLTSWPSLIYWTEGTLRLMKKVKFWRSQGLLVYFSINTGQDIHLIVQEKDVESLKKLLVGEDYIQELIINFPSKGTRLIDTHLF